MGRVTLKEANLNPASAVSTAQVDHQFFYVTDLYKE